MADSAARIDFDEAAAPATPSAAQVRLYAKSDGLLYSKDDAGTETLVSGGAGGGGGGGSELDYTQITSNVTVAGTTEGGATTVITSGAVTTDGSTPVMVEFFCPRVAIDISVAGQGVLFDLYDDATILGRIAVVLLGADGDTPVTGRMRVTPSNGSVFVVKAWKSAAGAVTVHASAGGTGAQVPTFIRIVEA